MDAASTKSRMRNFDIVNFDIMVDIIFDTDQIISHITHKLLIYTVDNKSYNNIISMYLVYIDNLHYVVKSSETRHKQPHLNS